MKSKVTYKTSGVDIDEGNLFVKAIQGEIARTKGTAVIDRKGSFGSLFALDKKKYRKPVLVSSTDGVGTKLLIAQDVGIHNTVGIDLVAMNVNDILCVGAKPLFFLDYIACGKLNTKVLKEVVKGVAKGCRESGMSLIGGETAEMPGMYKPTEYDLAGFAVGIVDEHKIIDGSTIEAGDIVIGFSSSGFHSNGYSLVRKVFSPAERKRMAKDLLKPTRIYAKQVNALTENFKIKAIAHMTGGAYYEKLTKVLPKGKCFVIEKGTWPMPKVFQILQKKGRIEDSEMYKTFNMGIGLAAVVSARSFIKVSAFLHKSKIRHYKIGYVVNDTRKKIRLESSSSSFC